MSSAKWRPFFLGFNVLRDLQIGKFAWDTIRSRFYMVYVGLQNDCYACVIVEDIYIYS